MENEKQLNTAESLALIKSMITATRSKLEKGGGTILLIWGYTSVAICTLVIILSQTTAGNWYNLVWWLIPAIGYPVSAIVRNKRAKPVRTYVDTFIANIWIITGITCILTPIAAVIAHKYDLIIPIISLILSIATATTGLTLKFCPLLIGGLISIAMALLMLVVGNIVWIFMVVFIVSMIIPGHILNYQARCSKS